MKLRSPLRTVRRGFTLIELLLVIGIIAILASIVIVAINPTRQLGQARDAQRRSDVNTILNAVYQYSIDHNGTFPYSMTGGAVGNMASGTFYPVCRCDANQCPAFATCSRDAGVAAANIGINLRQLSGSYVVTTPRDPSLPASSGTGITWYEISKDAGGRITVRAPHQEQTPAGISVTR